MSGFIWIGGRGWRCGSTHWDWQTEQSEVGLGLAITTGSFFIFFVVWTSAMGAIVGVILLDLGVQTTQVSNQTRIQPAARSP